MMAITVLVAVMQTAASDWAASRLAVAIERVAAALVEPAEEPPSCLRGSCCGCSRERLGK